MLSALRATQQALEATQTSTFGAQVHLYHIFGGSFESLRQPPRGCRLGLKTLVHNPP